MVVLVVVVVVVVMGGVGGGDGVGVWQRHGMVRVKVVVRERRLLRHQHRGTVEGLSIQVAVHDDGFRKIVPETDGKECTDCVKSTTTSRGTKKQTNKNN